MRKSLLAYLEIIVLGNYLKEIPFIVKLSSMRAFAFATRLAECVQLINKSVVRRVYNCNLIFYLVLHGIYYNYITLEKRKIEIESKTC